MESWSSNEKMGHIPLIKIGLMVIQWNVDSGSCYETLVGPWDYPPMKIRPWFLQWNSVPIKSFDDSNTRLLESWSSNWNHGRWNSGRPIELSSNENPPPGSCTETRPQVRRHIRYDHPMCHPVRGHIGWSSNETPGHLPPINLWSSNETPGHLTPINLWLSDETLCYIGGHPMKLWRIQWTYGRCCSSSVSYNEKKLLLWERTKIKRRNLVIRLLLKSCRQVLYSVLRDDV